MNFLVFGTGAIGMYLGGSLALDGHVVTFIDRPGPAEYIRTHGIQITEGNQTRALDAEIETDITVPLTARKYDAMIFSVKAYHTDGAAAALLPAKGQLPPILCFQNGIGNETKLEEILGATVIACTVTTAIGKPEIGKITVERKRGIGVANTHPAVADLVKVMALSGLNAQRFENGVDLKWSKLLTNLLANASSAILDMAPVLIFNHPGLFEMEIQMLRETLAVMEKVGIRVTNLPGTPVKALAFGAKYLPLFISKPLIGRAVGGGRGGKMPSFHIELYSQSGRSEVEYLNGMVAKIGKENGVPTPVNSALTQILLEMTRGNLAPDTYRGKPEALLARI